MTKTTSPEGKLEPTAVTGEVAVVQNSLSRITPVTELDKFNARLRNWAKKNDSMMLPKFVKDEDGQLQLDQACSGVSANDVRANVLVAEVTGVADINHAHAVLAQVAYTDLHSRDQFEKALNNSASAFSGLAPKDSLETMLAAQMIAAHNLAMLFCDRAVKHEDPNVITLNTERASKMMRIFISQAESLDKHRGKGCHQKVVVEHVSVHQGGQAAFGTFETGTPARASGRANEALPGEG